MIEFTIPGECVPQGRPRATKVGGRIRLYDPAKSKKYKRYVSLIAKQHVPKTPTDLPVVVDLKVYRPIPKSTSKKRKQAMLDGKIRPIVKPDNTNYAKGIEDALNGIAYKDDSQIVDINISKYYSDNPRVEIKIHELITNIY